MSSQAKELIFEEAARQKLLAGIEKLADVVCFTLGPNGRNVGVDRGYGSPAITNDGNTILRDIELADAWENMGASIAKQTAQKIKDSCGDGTTTVTVLLRALVTEGLKNVASGASPISIKRGMDQAAALLVSYIKEKARKIEGKKAIAEIASAAASQRKDIGENIASALVKVGTDGVVTIEEAKGTETTLDVVEGMQFDRGYISSYFCTDTENMKAELSNPAILCVDKKISSIQEILPVLQQAASSGRELLIIAEDLEGDVLATLVVNRLRGSLKITAVKAPGFGDRRKAMLQDIATLTGATVISEETGMNLKEATLEDTGSASKVVISKDSTTIVGGKGSDDALKARIAQIQSEIEAATSSYDKEKLEERKAKLSGGVAVIRVGAATESEAKQLKAMYEDSLNSTKAALTSGVVTGGGVTLLRAASVIDAHKFSGEEAVGARAVARACSACCRQIIVNCGFDASLTVADILSHGEGFGFNALTKKVEDLDKAGVSDPATVAIATIQQAVSAAGIVLLSECLIGPAEEDDEDASK